MSAPAEAAATPHSIKRINFLGRRVPILCQNVNGPCPLLAICNVLLLRGTLKLHDDIGTITAAQLVQLVGNFLLEHNTTRGADADPNRLANVQTAVSVIPRLLVGLEVNVGFTKVSKFEFTEEMVVFDLMGINLYHGWIVDPADEPAASAIGATMYNGLVEQIIEYRAARAEEQRRSGRVPVAVALPHMPDDGAGAGARPSDGSAACTSGDAGTGAGAGAGAGSGEGTPVDAVPLPDGAGDGTGDAPTQECGGGAESGAGGGAGSSDGSGAGGNGAGASDGSGGMPTSGDGSCGAGGGSGSSDTGGGASGDEAQAVVAAAVVVVDEDGTHEATVVARPMRVDERPEFAKAKAIDEFLTRSSGQLTYAGLMQLYEMCRERELSVFFRNNHFNCMFRYAGDLYLLVTDLGYADQSQVVWEKLDEIDGDTTFVNDHFKVPPPATSARGYGRAAAPAEQANADYLLALSLSGQQPSASTAHGVPTVGSATTAAPAPVAAPAGGGAATAQDQDLMLALALSQSHHQAHHAPGASVAATPVAAPAPPPYHQVWQNGLQAQGAAPPPVATPTGGAQHTGARAVPLGTPIIAAMPPARGGGVAGAGGMTDEQIARAIQAEEYRRARQAQPTQPALARAPQVPVEARGGARGGNLRPALGVPPAHGGTPRGTAAQPPKKKGKNCVIM